MKKYVVVFLILFFFCGASLVALAQSDEKPDTMQIHKDHFYAGETYQIPETEIEHNLFAIGSTLKNKANVGKDVFILGNNYTQSGEVQGNSFLCGNKIWIEKDVFGDVFILSNYVEISPDSTIHGNLFVFSSTLTMNGSVEGVVQFTGDTMRFTGLSTGADVNANTIIIEDNAKIHTLRHNSNASISLSDSAVIENIDSKPMPVKPEETQAPPKKEFPFQAKIFSLLASLFIAFAVYYVFHKTSKNSVEGLKKNFWTSLGIGILFLVALPVCLLVLLIVGFGWKVAIALLFGSIACWMFAHAIAGIALGYYVFLWTTKKERYDWLSVLTGVVLLYFVRWIPIVGALISILLTIIMLGAFLRVMWIENHKME